MKVRYEVLCGGRLLKVIEQVDVTSLGHAEADGTEFVDGQYWWMADDQRIQVDVAQAMMADLCGRCSHSFHGSHSDNRENCDRCPNGLCTAAMTVTVAKLAEALRSVGGLMLSIPEWAAEQLFLALQEITGRG